MDRYYICLTAILCLLLGIGIGIVVAVDEKIIVHSFVLTMLLLVFLVSFGGRKWLKSNFVSRIELENLQNHQRKQDKDIDGLSYAMFGYTFDHKEVSREKLEGLPLGGLLHVELSSTGDDDVIVTLCVERIGENSILIHGALAAYKTTRMLRVDSLNSIPSAIKRAGCQHRIVGIGPRHWTYSSDKKMFEKPHRTFHPYDFLLPEGERREK